MTKLEAWQAWCTTAGTADLATEFTLENSSHGKAFSFAWHDGYASGMKAEREECAKVCDDWPNGRDDVDSIAAAIRSRT